MYEQVKITNTCACITAIANSRAENAIMKAKGINAITDKTTPEVSILKVNPLNIFKSIWPESRATNLSLSISPGRPIKKNFFPLDQESYFIKY